MLILYEVGALCQPARLADPAALDRLRDSEPAGAKVAAVDGDPQGQLDRVRRGRLHPVDDGRHRRVEEGELEVGGEVEHAGRQPTHSEHKDAEGRDGVRLGQRRARAYQLVRANVGVDRCAWHVLAKVAQHVGVRRLGRRGQQAVKVEALEHDGTVPDLTRWVEHIDRRHARRAKPHIERGHCDFGVVDGVARAAVKCDDGSLIVADEGAIGTTERQEQQWQQQQPPLRPKQRLPCHHTPDGHAVPAVCGRTQQQDLHGEAQKSGMHAGGGRQEVWLQKKAGATSGFQQGLTRSRDSAERFQHSTLRRAL